MTHDTHPTTNTAEIQDLFETLWSVYQGPVPTSIAESAFKKALSTRLKLIYELWADQLINQHTDTDQVHRAVALYTTYPDDSPSCMADVDAPVPPVDCSATAVTETRSELIRCQRLLGQHAFPRPGLIPETSCPECVRQAATVRGRGRTAPGWTRERQASVITQNRPLKIT